MGPDVMLMVCISLLMKKHLAEFLRVGDWRRKPCWGRDWWLFPLVTRAGELVPGSNQDEAQEPRIWGV